MANKVYTVKSGDSLWAIAQKNNTTVSAILKANPTIAKRRESGKVDIFSGSKVKLPGTGGQGAKKAAPARSADEARARATQKSNAAAMARYQRMQTEKKRDAAAASRGGTKKITAQKPSRVPEELRNMGEGMKKAALVASLFLPAGRAGRAAITGGRAATRAIGGRTAAAASKGRPAITAAAAPRAIGPGPVGKRIAVQQQRVATLQANIKRASASRRTKNPNTTAGELQKMREQLRLEKEQLKRLQSRFGGK